MKNLIKKHITIVHIIIIVLIALLEVVLMTWDSKVLGYGGDWFLQSLSFYEYFRDLFYETGDVFPNLALHIGGGQNIYYLAYYGLFSPYLLLFYCLPFIKAGDFLMLTNFLNIIISTILLYIFLRKNNYSKNISLLGALFFLTSTGIVFFNYIFVMFVQYIPFLMLGLLGTKEFLDFNKSTLLIISVILIIITSYFFSIPCISCLCLYALYYYMKINTNLKFKMIVRDGIRYIGKIVLSIIISSFFLLPIIYVVLTGRTVSVSEFDFSNLLLGINIRYLMYDANGLGLSFIVWFAIVYNILCVKKEIRFLTIMLFIILGIPLCVLLLNGFLYESGKVFIPFIPLFIILILEMFNSIKNDSNKKVFLIFLCSVVLSVIIIEFDSLLRRCVCCVDIIVTFIILMLYKKSRKNIYVFVLVCFVLGLSICFVYKKISLMSVEKYAELYENIKIDWNEYINNGTLSIYRTEFDSNDISVNYSDASSVYRTTIYSSTYNKLYKDVFYITFNNNFPGANKLKTFSQKNLFFEKFMGVRYLVTNSDVPYGYVKIADFDNMSLYENDNVYGIGVASSNVLNYNEYEKMSFIEKLLVYQNNIIVNDESKNSDLELEYQKVDLNFFRIKTSESVTVKHNKGSYIIDSSFNGKLTLELKEPLKNKLLIIRFDVDNKLTCENDKFKLIMSINGVKNALTCDWDTYYNDNKTFDYVISSNNDIKELNIEFYRGIYDISNIEVYAVDNTFFDKNNTTSLNVDFDKTNGDVIEGNIYVNEEGYFMFTIPYDNGYKAYVDGELVEIEKVSDGFIGFKISEGEHKIKLTFEAPLAKIGKIISFVGVIILIILKICERKQKR